MRQLPVETVGGRIKKLRMSKGMNASDLARRVSVSATAVANWEKGSTPRGDVLVRTANVLGVSPEYLSTGKSGNATAGSSIDEIVERFKKEIAKTAGVASSKVTITLSIKSK